MHWLILTHRYLGIAGALLMTLWCISGFVMMYVPYPALSEDMRLKGLQPLAWEGCCHLDADMTATEVATASAEMLNGAPVLRFASRPGQGWRPLTDAAPRQTLSDADVRQAAETFARHAGIHGAIAEGQRIDYDQWTVSGEFRAFRPLTRFRFTDPAGTELYIADTDGRAVQMTTRAQRFWNWLGAVPHWLYFTEFRRNAALWTQVVIWTSVGGCFLAVTGLWIGVKQFARAGGWSPYQGIMWWHHLPGLIFGLFALTWVFSGLLSMNPWGLLESSGAGAERDRIRGAAVSVSGFVDVLSRLAPGEDAPVSVTAAPFAQRLYAVATYADGRRIRLDAMGAEAPLTERDAQNAARLLSEGATAELLTAEDAYYYTRPDYTVRLPIYRIVDRGDAGIRYYLDAVSGQLVEKIDPAARGYRWLFMGLHRLDFTAGLRSSAAWRIFSIVLLLGVTGLCATGLYIGVRRLLHVSG